MNSLFFRKNLDFYNYNFFNKLFFYNDSNLLLTPVIYSLGTDYFLTNFLPHNLTGKIYNFLKSKNFFYPFGFLAFLLKIFKIAFGKSFRKDHNLFEKDENADKFNHVITKVFIKRRKIFKFNLRSLKFTRLAFSFSQFFYKRIFLFRRKFFVLLKKSVDSQFLSFFLLFRKSFLHFLKSVNH